MRRVEERLYSWRQSKMELQFLAAEHGHYREISIQTSLDFVTSIISCTINGFFFSCGAFIVEFLVGEVHPKSASRVSRSVPEGSACDLQIARSSEIVSEEAQQENACP